MDDQVGIQHHQAPALEEKYQLDPEQMSFTQILPEPAEVNSLVSHQLRSHCHLLSLSSLVVKAAGRTDQQERSGLQGAV